MTYTAGSGCMLQSPLQERLYGAVGRFGFREPDLGRAGVVIGVPHGSAEQAAVDFAQAVREATGAGLVIAYDFKNQRIPVAQPLVHTSLVSWSTANSALSGSVYPEFRKLLESTALGQLNFYVGIRLSEDTSPVPRIEVATSGFSFEQLKTFKQVYAEIRDRSLNNRDGIASVDLVLNPLDDISWNSYGLRNHGVLMLAEKGMVLRLPKMLAGTSLKTVYLEIVTRWIQGVLRHSRESSSKFQAVNFERMTYGRIDTVLARNAVPGVVIAAPHGSFDWYTAELVEELSDQTAISAVITRGFTPTECSGWRINVNRPTERRYPTDTIERKTDRAGEVYQRFKEVVLRAGGGRLDTYIEMHQNGSEPNIDVATLGISREEAIEIKNAYREIRDRVLSESSDLPKVNLVIEPVDQVAIGAWAAKDHGILRLSKSSFHFELPAQRVFYRKRTRRAYTEILSELVDRIVKSHRNVIAAKGISSALPSSAD